VGVVVAGDDVGTGRARGDLPDGERAVLAPEPLHVREARFEAEGFDRAHAEGAGVVEFGPVDHARVQDHPLNPRVLDDLEGRRQIARERLKAGFAADGDGLEAVFATAQELLGEHGVGAGRTHGFERRVQLGRPVDAPRRFAAHAGEGLEHEGVPDVFGEFAGLRRRRDGAVLRAGQAVPPQLVFHAGFVSKQIGRLHGRAGHAERLAHLCELNLHRLEDARDPVQFAVPALERPRGFDELPGVEGVAHLHAIREEASVGAPRGLVVDAEQADAVEAGDGPGEAQGGLEGVGGDEKDVSHRKQLSMAATDGGVSR
jgi:hypothetical protein